MGIFELIAVVLLLASFFGIAQHKLAPSIPHAIGIMILALISSVSIIIIDIIIPYLDLKITISDLIHDIQFEKFLLEGILGLLLFAGALHVKLEYLKKHYAIILIMASIGTAISTLIIGFGFNALSGSGLLIALTLGVILSPTDPVVVMGVLNRSKISESVKGKIAGESLANDAFSFVGFIILSSLAFPITQTDGGNSNFLLSDIIKLFTIEVFGGIFLGFSLGLIVLKINKGIDDYSLELLLTITLAFSGYTLAHWLHFSAPITAIVSGLLVGHHSFKDNQVLSEQSQLMINNFWTLIDEILNIILFLILGVELLTIQFNQEIIILSIIMIVVSIIARLFAVYIPLLTLRPFIKYTKDVGLLMWVGGVKGGLSLALVLLLPESDIKNTLICVTYISVVFSILFQGLSVGKVASLLSK